MRRTPATNSRLPQWGWRIANIVYLKLRCWRTLFHEHLKKQNPVSNFADPLLLLFVLRDFGMFNAKFFHQF